MERQRWTYFESESDRMAIRLHHTQNTPQVFWSAQGNSYVISPNGVGYYNTEDGEGCDLISINGHGECRWIVSSERGNTSGDTDAAAYFKLTWIGWRAKP